MKSKILLAVDDSEHAARATKWCAEHADALDADVVVLHAVDKDYAFGAFGAGAPIPLVPPVLDAEQLDELRDVVARDWCKPLADVGVHHDVVIAEGRPSSAILQTAEAMQADMIVCGRRRRGGVAEMLLGSTSHELSHHAKVPLVIIP
jgi:nucleotide-binding universal stress UspA family protein